MPFSALLRSGLLMGLAILLGRLAGFARELVLTQTFGLGMHADVAVLLLTLPDLFVNLLLSGGLGVALIPELRQADLHRALMVLVQAALVVAVAFSLLAMMLMLTGAGMLSLLAPGMPTEGRILFLEVLPVVAWSVPLAALAGVASAWLNAKDRFFLAAAGTLMINASVVAGLLLMKHHPSLYGLGLVILLAGFIRLASLLLSLPLRDILRAGIAPWALHPDMARRFVEAFLAASCLLLLPVVARALASLQGVGGIAILNLSSKLVDLPAGVAMSVLSIVLFPRLAECYRLNDVGGAHTMVLAGSRFVLLLGGGIALPCALYADGLVRLSLHGSQMLTPAQLSEVARMMAIGLLALPFLGWSSLLVSAFNANGQTRVPLLVNAMGIVLAFISAALLAKPFGLLGIMSALVATNAMIGGVLFFLLCRSQGLPMQRLFDVAFLRDIMVAVAATLLVYFIFPVGTLLIMPLCLGLACGLVSVLAVIVVNSDYRQVAGDMMRKV